MYLQNWFTRQFWLTLMVTDEVDEHPPLFVAVTVKVVVAAGYTVVDAEEAPDDHE